MVSKDFLQDQQIEINPRYIRDHAKNEQQWVDMDSEAFRSTRLPQFVPIVFMMSDTIIIDEYVMNH